ncbi:serine/threonine-protein phosphatase 4 regulatory subunit 2 [Leguminivora glycinivorella]|uniref:serine/threonine-protein phosphatase 4 regulatory subunit 2 n=1 Tax=Leguminivora glycinivorella TaxID=1035111 RepID=UPI00200EF4E9|nr:serine/threonine-protein phosphatase 4 regulatory subunit 2 [Leguminivora glycinivorella]
MENAEEIFHFLEDFSKRKPKTIPQELNEYLAYVARTGDPVYQWPLVKCLFKEKLLNVITDFYETTPGVDIPPYPNVDPFNYDIMKNSLLERLDAFTSAPFTVQRICELLTFPRKQYNRIDKFMRAIEKNILVVSTREPGAQRHPEPENGEAVEPVVNGSDSNSEYNVDVEMEDMSWKENAEQQSSEPQPSSSDTHISVDDIEARLQAKQNTPMETQDKTTTEYESVTPPELNVGADEPVPENKSSDAIPEIPTSEVTEKLDSTETAPATAVVDEAKIEVEMKSDVSESPALVIPEITVDDAEMTEQKLLDQAAESEKEVPQKVEVSEKADDSPEIKPAEEPAAEQPVSTDESSSDSTIKDEEPKHISEVSTSSEESSSSCDNTDGNSNSPKTDENNTDTIQEESNQESIKLEEPVKEEIKEPEIPPCEEKKEEPQPVIESENYSISDISSGLPQPPAEAPSQGETSSEEVKETPDIEKKEEAKTESIEEAGDS